MKKPAINAYLIFIGCLIGFKLIEFLFAETKLELLAAGNLAFLGLYYLLLMQKRKTHRLKLMIKRIEWSGEYSNDPYSVVAFNNLIEKKVCLICEKAKSQGHEENCFMGDMAD